MKFFENIYMYFEVILENFPILRACPQVGLAGGLKSWLGFAGSMTGTAALSSGPEKRVGCNDHLNGDEKQNESKEG